ncbi:MAG: NAD(P)-dependent oxidoreductase [Phycisphaerae bacterium]|nr:NAD(P)-dependent oxidoreductase [Phycisphaerae bacterium]
MKVLITGAAGMVGGILRPALEAEHDCRFLDLVLPADADDRWVQGSLLDEAVLTRAMAGMDAVVHLAMGDCHDARAMYDVNVKGMHFVLDGAVKAGIQRIVYSSSMSVYGVGPGQYGDEQTGVPDATTDYGLTKVLSEKIAWAFTQRHPDLSVIALQLYGPMTEEKWAALREQGKEECVTAPDDLCRAFLSALAVRHKGFDGVYIATDLKQQWMRLRKAEWLLGWRPEGR